MKQRQAYAGGICTFVMFLRRTLRKLQHTLYEGNPFILAFWGRWAMSQGSVRIFLQQPVSPVT